VNGERVRRERYVGLGFHDLCRANATELLAAGVDIKTAQTWLGHSEARLTLDPLRPGGDRAGQGGGPAHGGEVPAHVGRTWDGPPRMATTRRPDAQGGPVTRASAQSPSGESNPGPTHNGPGPDTRWRPPVNDKSMVRRAHGRGRPASIGGGRAMDARSNLEGLGSRPGHDRAWEQR
jgi:hypothetical protein